MTLPDTMVFVVLLSAALVACLLFVAWQRRRNMRLERENRVIRKKLRSSKRKIEQWKRGWGADKQHTLDALSDAFLMINPQGRIMFANKKAELLFETFDLEGMPLSDYVGNEALSREVEKAWKAEGGYISEFFLPAGTPLDLDKREGETYWYIDAAPVAGSEGYRRIVIRDITLQHQTEQVRKDFVANASHELRTPMAIILGYLETIRDEDLIETAPEMARNFLGTMYKHGLRLKRIVEDMLMISKLESGEEASLKEKPFDLRSCLLDVFTRLESIAEQNDASLKINFEPENIRLLGDQFYWTQIFFNLVENALKQNADESDLAIEAGAKVNGEHLQLWVSDNGIGIPAMHLPYIFRRFYRIDEIPNKEVKGTGLGLSIVKRAVEAHGGTLDVTSVPGEETRFFILLPLLRVVDGNS